MASRQDHEAEAGPSDLSVQAMLALLGLENGHRPPNASSVMSFHQEPDDPEAGPSGLSVQEMFALVGGLDTSDVEDNPPNPEERSLPCEEVLGESDDDDACREALDRFERQRAFQTQLLQQSGGGMNASGGTFDFETTNVVDRQSRRMGVRERHFTTRLRQRGNFIGQQNIVKALQEGLRRVVDRVLATTPNLHDEDRLYFTLSSNRLTINFKDGDYGPENGAKEALAWTLCSIGWPKHSTAMNNLKWTIRFNCPSPKSIMPLREPGENAVPSRVTQPSKH